MEYILRFRYIVTVSMIWHLSKRAVLLPPKLKNLQFGGYIKSGESSSVILLLWFKFSCMHLTVLVFALSSVLVFSLSFIVIIVINFILRLWIYNAGINKH